MASDESYFQDNPFQHIVEMAPVAIVMVNKDGIIEVANKHAEKIFGYMEQELLGMSVEVLMPARYQAQHSHHVVSFYKEPSTRSMGKTRNELVGRRKDGTEFTVEVGLNPSLSDSGYRVIATIIDTSERTRQQRQLHDLTEMHKAILDSTNLSIICTDNSGIIQIFNCAAERILGYFASEVIGKLTPVTFHDPLELVEYSAHLSEELGTTVEPGLDSVCIKSRLLRVPDVREWNYVHRDGTHVPVLLSVTALNDQRGEISGYVGIAIDMREQKLQQSQQHDNEEFFRVLYETSGNAHILCSPGNKFRGANQAAVKLFGFNHVDEITCLTPAAVSPEFQKDGRRSEEKAIELMDLAITNGSHKFQWLHQRADGTQFDAEVCLTRFTIGDETMIEATVRDITESNRAEQAKNDFISTVRHELRTPLTSINGVLSLMDQGVLGAMSEQAKPLIHMAHKNCRRLTMLINDLLDIEKMESGKITLNLKLHDLMPLILQSIEANDDLAIQFNVSFSVIAQEQVQLRVDEARLIQVLTNFLSNAAKFSSSGSQVTVAVRKIHHINQSLVRVEVVDQGPGIPMNFRNRIFTKFSQADSSDTKNTGGTGLGLAIAKQLIERMGGSIGFYSTIGIGSCFYFELPLDS